MGKEKCTFGEKRLESFPHRENSLVVRGCRRGLGDVKRYNFVRHLTIFFPKTFPQFFPKVSPIWGKTDKMVEIFP
jgi:hypothetical protein